MFLSSMFYSLDRPHFEIKGGIRDYRDGGKHSIIFFKLFFGQRRQCAKCNTHIKHKLNTL